MAKALALNTVAQLKEDGFRLVSRPIAVASFDPAGAGADHAALTILQREEWQLGEPDEPKFAVRMVCRFVRAERMPPGNEFPENKARLMRLAKVLQKDGFYLNWRLVIEANGMGISYIQDLRRRLPLGHVIGCTTVATTINDRAATDRGWTMPRQAALDHFRGGIEMQTIKFWQDQTTKKPGPGLADFVKELRTMVWRGRKVEAQEGAHDDIVMSGVQGYWAATKILPATVRALPPGRKMAA